MIVISTRFLIIIASQFSLLALCRIHNYTSSINAQFGSTFYSAQIHNNGKIGYNCAIFQNGSFIIQKYNLVTNPPLLIRQSQTIQPSQDLRCRSRFFVYKEYQITFTPGHSLNQKVIIYNDTTLQFIAYHQFGRVPQRFSYAQSRGLIVLSSLDVSVACIQQVNFPFPDPDQIHFLSLFSQVNLDSKGFLSNNQEHYSMIFYNKIWIFSLSTFNLVFEYEALVDTIGNEVSQSQDHFISGDWHSTQNVFYVCSLKNKLYIINVTANFSVKKFQFINDSNQQYLVYQIKYFPDTNGIAGLTLKQNAHEIKVILLNLDNMKSTQYLISINQPEYYLTFELQNSSFIQFLSNNVIIFYEINVCQTGNIYFSCSKSCQPCTSCSHCSKIGCQFCPLNPSTDNNNSYQSQLENFSQNQASNESLLDFLSSKPVINYNNMIKSTLGGEALRNFNLIPGGRKILGPIFSFFVNFDDLWLYTYHLRDYGPIIQTFIDRIKQLQEQKWKTLDFKNIARFLGYDQNSFLNYFTFKKAQTSKKFLQIEQNPNGFFPNTPNFLFSNMFLTFFIFVSFKLLRKLLSGFHISKLLRQFQYWQFLWLMLIEGNVQYFTYLLMFDFTKLYAINLSSKALNGMVIMIGFTVLVCGGFIYVLVRIWLQKKSHHLMDNYVSSIRGIVQLALCSGLRNITIGAAHFFLDGNYHLKINVLLLIEGIFLGIYVFGLSRKLKLCPFQKKSIVWYQITFPSIIRIILIMTFKTSYSNYLEGNVIIDQGIMAFEIILVYCYIGTFLIATIFNLVGTVVQIADLFIIQNNLSSSSQKKQQIKFSIQQRKEQKRYSKQEKQVKELGTKLKGFEKRLKELGKKPMFVRKSKDKCKIEQKITAKYQDKELSPCEVRAVPKYIECKKLLHKVVKGHENLQIKKIDKGIHGEQKREKKFNRGAITNTIRLKKGKLQKADCIKIIKNQIVRMN